ncbi:MAG: DUF3568 domain-containing protein [Gemmataceae bacterium]|nr:DUF3568 domain-containing protein [Gemmataceae bacterium]
MQAKWFRRLLLLAAASLAVMQGGCLWVAAGAAGGAALGYAYCNGKLCHVYAASLDDTRAAARAGLADLGMPVQEESQEPGSASIKSQTADGDTVRVSLNIEPSKFPADGPMTRVCVRVATFGDHPASARLQEQIAVHLVMVGAATPLPSGAPPAAPPVITPPPAPPGALPSTTAPPPLLPPETAPNPRPADARKP